MDSNKNLKDYLLDDFRDTKYKGNSIIDIFVGYRKYYNSLVKEGFVRDDAKTFLKRKEIPIKNAQSISVYAFRKLKYEQIIDEYVNVNSPKEIDNSEEPIINENKIDEGADYQIEFLDRTSKEKVTTKIDKDSCFECRLFAIDKPLRCTVHDCGGNLIKKGFGIYKDGKKIKKGNLHECFKCGTKHMAISTFDKVSAFFIPTGETNLEHFREDFKQILQEKKSFWRGKDKSIYWNKFCPYDNASLPDGFLMSARIDNEVTKIFVQQCPVCHRLYTTVLSFEDYAVLQTNDAKIINLNPDKVIERPGMSESEKKETVRKHTLYDSPYCYVFSPANSPKQCRDPQCKGRIETSNVDFENAKGKPRSRNTKRCSVCGKYYIAYNNFRNEKYFLKCLNTDEYSQIEREIEARRQERKARKKKETPKPQKTVTQKFKQQKTTTQKPIRYVSLTEQERIKRMKEFNEIAERFARRAEERKKAEEEKNPKVKREIPDNINVKDFVVRRTTFKCMHNDHHLENIVAQLGIINSKGEVNNVRVSAGYCPECEIFFIMESTYQSLKSKGTPICRVSDEKSYLKNASFINGMRLAQESILMQYGYTVSQEEGLSSSRRRKILALLVDNGVLTKSDIISYLDFFISQRQYQARFERAISKWESDREFISEYRSGDYTTYGVGGIYRRY